MFRAIKEARSAFLLGRFILENMTKLDNFDAGKLYKDSNKMIEHNTTIHSVVYLYEKKGKEMYKEFYRAIDDKF